MFISEIKNDLAKVIYRPDEISLVLSDFLLVEDTNQSLVSQIISIESLEKEADTNSAIVKFVLSIDKDLSLSTYNGYTPAKDSKVLYIDPNEIAQLLKTDEKNMFWGEISAHPVCKVHLSTAFLDNKPYIQCDRKDILNDIVNTITNGIKKNGEKFVLLDFDKAFDAVDGKRVVVGKDFKLPLNYEILDYIYQNDLKDCPIEERGLVQDILIDIQNYVKSIKEGFIPFNVFKKVVDEQYIANPKSTGLILLRNKLMKYADEGILAQTKSDFDKLNELIKFNDKLIVDAFSVNENWQKIMVEFLASQIQEEVFFMLKYTEENSSKKIITSIYDNKVIKPIAISAYSFKYATTIKALARNLVLATPMYQTDDFAGYTSFLHKLNQDEFVVWGQNTLYIPLILRPRAEKVTKISQEVDEQIKKDVDSIFLAGSQEVSEAKPGVVPEFIAMEDAPQDEVIGLEEEQAVIGDTELDFELPQTIEDMPIESESDETGVEDVVPAAMAFGEILSAEPEDDAEEDIKETLVADIDDAALESIVNSEALIEDDAESAVQAPSEPLVELDEINFDEVIEYHEEAPEEPNQPVTLNIAQAPALHSTQQQETVTFTPIPIYKAENEAENRPIQHRFSEGSVVLHPKYGKGVVEKNIIYGNKSLCSIQFDNLGRRLLDPELSELEPA